MEAAGARARRLAIVGRASVSARVVPAAAGRPRRAVGIATVDAGGGVILRTSERAAPYTVTLEGRRVLLARATGPCPDDAYPIDDACAALAIGRDWFSPEMRARGTQPVPDAIIGFYARAARRIRQAEGGDTLVSAMVTPRGGVTARVGTLPGQSRLGFGAALAMDDVDDDGAAELIVSAATPIGSGDRLSVLRARPDGSLLRVWTSDPLPGSILIAAVGDLDGDSLPELLAVEEPAPTAGPAATARLWVIR
jgi:hypothetical protein